MGLPTFHAMGMLLQLSYPLSTGNEVVVYTPQFPAPPVVPHPQNIYEVALTTGCTALLALPSFVEVRRRHCLVYSVAHMQFHVLGMVPL